MNIKSKHKFKGKDTKALIKDTYKKDLPAYLLYKQKTGWTVPIGYWLMDQVDKKLDRSYDQNIGKDRLKQLKRSQKAGKGLIPPWQVKNWKEKYKIK